MDLVRASPRLNKCSVVDKGKIVIDKPTEEEDNLQDLIDQIDAKAEEEELAF